MKILSSFGKTIIFFFVLLATLLILSIADAIFADSPYKSTSYGGVLYEYTERGFHVRFVDINGNFDTFTFGEDAAKVSTCYDEKITSVEIPSEIEGKPVVKIDNRAFYGCVNIKTVVIPPTVEEIGDYAFSGCTALESVVLTPSVKIIEYNCFNKCESLTDIYFTGTEDEWNDIIVYYPSYDSSINTNQSPWGSATIHLNYSP